MAKLLSELGLTAQQGGDLSVADLCVNSADVRLNSLFVALPGVEIHGAKYISDAIELGANAILTDVEGAKIASNELAEFSGAVVVVQDVRQTLAYAAALWYEHQPPAVVAVTGTNGKTSVTNFTRQIWQHLGAMAINIGTTGVEGDWSAPSPHTTPEPLTLHKMLNTAVGADITHVAMEASSHGLSQRRLDGVSVMAAGFTNLSQDHLDYHETLDEYFMAKMGLFSRVLSDQGVAVVNYDDPRAREVENLCMDRGIDVLRVGRHIDADLRIVQQRFDEHGQDLRLDFVGHIAQVRLDLIGGFQADNAAMAAALVIASGGDPEDVISCLPELRGVNGRMQRAGTRSNGAPVYIDYAHTPDAIETAIKALRGHVMGRIIAIIGAGGNRDTTKRPLMGKAASEAADIVIVTDDNPRSEDAASIRQAVLQGTDQDPTRIHEVQDRAEAILRGVAMLDPGDSLLICGKGHETGQIIGDDIFPFDDREQASIAIAALEDM